MNILFICSRNKWRSRTAETIFKNHPVHQVRSAGTESTARIRVIEKLVNWADLILVMEKRHLERLRERFGPIMDEKETIVLHIHDDYQYMDKELIEILEMTAGPYLD